MSRAPIAVVGTACRLPGAPDPAAFWRRLAAGDDFVTEVPRERWDVDAYFQEGAASPGKMFTRWGAFLDRVDLFDPRFFRITEREAAFMDPQQRLLLETAWDALADAGRPGDSMAGSRTGVFVGISSYDYGTLIMEDLRLMSAFSGLGSALSVAANRLSYCLDLRGPSLSVDTACSSSLVALHLACESLARGESDTALVGGVNVVLRPNMMVGFSQAAMMARDGRCKTFDARADGFVRAEGSVVMVLKPLEAAIRDRDRIHAVIRGSATNQDGLTNGIAAPSGRAQTAVIRAALESAGVEPCSVSYVEAHGTGTSIGDAIEVGALRTAYLAGRPERESLTVGSTKTNLGHTEAASGLVGVLKLILSLAHEALPKHLHLETPNPQLGLHDGRLRIPTEVLSWPRTGRPRLAGVSAFGFGGTNAHAILEEPPAATPSRLKARSVHVLPVHAKTETQLRAQAARLKERVQSDPGAIAALVHSAATAASRFPQRGVCAGRDAKELAAGLDAIASGSSSAHAFAGAGRSAPRLAWIFSGQGTQRWGMGRVLYETEPVYKDAFDRVAACIDARRGTRLSDVVFGPDAVLIERTEWTQPALLATGWALAALWRSFGLEPDFVLGHSIGEITAAAVAGVMSIEGAARLVEARARLMQSVTRPGAMLSLRAGVPGAEVLIAPWADSVQIAAENTATDVVVSGGAAEIDAIADACRARGIEAKRLAVSHAFHSPLMDPILDQFEREAAEVSFSPPEIPLVSNLTGSLHEGSPSPSYWRRHLREAVRFESGVRTLADLGADLFLEVGPGSTALVRSTAHPAAACVASLPRGRDEDLAIAEALAALVARGVSVDWRKRDRDRPSVRVELPGYPFDRRRFWLPDLGGLPGSADHPLLGERIELASPGSPKDSTFRSFISAEAMPLLTEHRVFGRPLFPGAAWMEMALAAARRAGRAMSLSGIVFERPMWLSGAREVQLSIRGDAIEIHGAPADASPRSWTRHASARLAPDETATPRSEDSLAADGARAIDVPAAYEQFAKKGLDYGARFRTMRSAVVTEDRCVAEVVLPEESWPEAAPYLVHPGLLDGAFQALALAAGSLEDAVFLPSRIGRCRLGGGAPAGVVIVEARIDRRSDDEIEGSLTLRAPGGAEFARIDGFVARLVDPSALVAAGSDHEDLRHTLSWRPSALSSDQLPAAEPPARVLCDEGPLAAALVARGCVAIRARDYGETLAALQASSEPTLIVTRGARLVGKERRAGNEARAAALWGLGRVVNTERRSPQVRLLDLDPAGDDVAHEAEEILREIHWGSNEESVAIRSRRRHVERLAPEGRPSGLLESPAGRPFRIAALKRGSFEGLGARPLQRRSPGPGEVEIRLSATGLNFRDVMNALGTYPGDPGEIGIEGAGVVETVGRGVDHLRPGDRVAALHPGLLGSFATIPASLAAPLPEGLALEDAAAIPVVYLTAHHALEVLTRVERGTRVLIHAAAGGVGLAAVQIAVRAGAEVFATAGTEEKRALLRSMGVSHTASSRTLDFARAFKEASSGEGVDVVLNSLPGDVIERSLGLLSRGGAYVEIGKTGTWSAARVRDFRADVRYHVLALDDLVAQDPDSIGRALQALLARFGRGELNPSPRLVVPAARARAAFRHLSFGRHIGKVVLTVPPFEVGLGPRVRRDGSYVITGGSGGVGLEMLRWLTLEGAGHVVLVSRGDLDDAGRRRAEEALAAGTRVSVARADVSDLEALERALRAALTGAPPWRGLIHAAGALADAPLDAQTPGNFDLVSRPKNVGFANLESIERALGATLDFCLATSSLAALSGNAGQAPYAASNLWLAEQMQDRNARGLAGTAIHFGPWDAIGMTSRVPAGMLRQLGAAGISVLTAEQATRGLRDALAADRPEMGVFRIDYSRAQALRGRSLFKDASPTAPKAPSATRFRLVDRVREQPAAERPAFVRQFLARELAAVTGAPAETLLSPDLRFADLGLDSLMAVEFRHRLQEAVEPHVELAASVLFTHPTLEALSSLIAEETQAAAAKLPGPSASKRSDEARVRLFAIPYAGGGASAYARWSSGLPAWIDFEPLQLPGREERSAEPLAHGVPELARQLADVIATPGDTRRYALFGHSFGATLAVATARELRRRGAPLPVHLALSGLGPSVDGLRRAVGPRPSDDRRLLLTRLETAGLALPIPPLDERMRDAMLRVLAADLDAAVRHAWDDEPVLDIETSLWGGASDRGTTLEDLAAWSAFVRPAGTPRLCDGGHFYWREDPRALLTGLVEILARHAPATPETAATAAVR